jgi:hypothetical protein
VLDAIARADRICLVEPARPTWVGDRLHASEVRVRRAYGLDLAPAWPRIWLIVPQEVRLEISAARDSLGASARLTGWAVLYLLLAIWWWPAALMAVIAGATGAVNARLAASDLAELIEAAVDLYCRELAAQLGHVSTGQLTPEQGRELATLMRKSRWDPRSPLAE